MSWRRPFGLAWGGVVAGHAIAYVLAYPVARVRLAHLHETGHGGFGILLVLGFAAAGLALSSTFLRAIRRKGTPVSVASLLPLQVGLFLGLELAERGFDLSRTLSDHAVGLGILVQVVLAFALAWLARGAAAAGGWLAGAPRVRASRALRASGPIRMAEPAPPDPVALGRRRAPPELAVA